MPRKIIDETGNRYGRLTVIDMAGTHDKSFHIVWNCKCDCGNTKTVSANQLRQGQIKSCGCLRTTEGKKAYKEWRMKQDGIKPKL